MPDISKEKALRQAAFTVGVAFVIATGIILYLVHPYMKEWPALIYIVPAIIAVSALLLLPLVQSRYANGPKPQLTRRQNIARAWLYGCLAGAYILVAVFDRGPEKGSPYKLLLQWGIVGSWLVAAIDHLYRARRKPEDLPGPNDY